MKKIFYLISIFVYIIFAIRLYDGSITIPTLSSGLNVYALITNNSCYLYKTPTNTDGFTNKLFLLEESYYVKVLEQENDDFFRVQYLDIVGFVKTSDVCLVNEVPLMPYLDGITFDISPSMQSVTLRSEPNSQDDTNIIATVNQQNGIDYIGKISGNESIPSLGNIWYYCQVNIDNNMVRGYLYAPYANNLSPIVPNNEMLTKTSIEKINATQSLLQLKLSTENIIIIVISLPAVLVLYLLLKPTKMIANQ